MRQLSVKEQGQVQGGSPLLGRIGYLLGLMFTTPGRMAVDGAAPHEILGFK